MEKIGSQPIWSYFDETRTARAVSNRRICTGEGHTVRSYFELAMKVAELQFLNRDHVMLFRGQADDHRSQKNGTTLNPTLFRPDRGEPLRPAILRARFERLKSAESKLVRLYRLAKFRGADRLARHRSIRWAILQHYGVCSTPLLDVTQSLRISATFAAERNRRGDAYLYVLGVPNRSGAVTASAETGLQIICLSSACPPEAVRPHMQEGFLLGEYPEVVEYDHDARSAYATMDFSRRLVAKFRLKLDRFWTTATFRPASWDAIYPRKVRDPLLPITDRIRREIESDVAEPSAFDAGLGSKRVQRARS
jgi:FRG domain-containing protein